MAITPAELFKKLRIVMFTLSAIFLVFGIYSLQSKLFEDDIMAYSFVIIGVVYFILALLLVPYLIKAARRNMDQRNHEQR